MLTASSVLLHEAGRICTPEGRMIKAYPAGEEAHPSHGQAYIIQTTRGDAKVAR